MSGNTAQTLTVDESRIPKESLNEFDEALPSTKVLYGYSQSGDHYSMMNKKRGIVLIFNNYKFDEKSLLPIRKGSLTDSLYLYRIFSSWNFDVKFKENKSDSEMKAEANKVSKMDHSNYDCFVMCILSHRDKNDIYSADGNKIKLEDLSDHFKGDKCKSLVGKPKIFLIQACKSCKLEKPDGYEDSSKAKSLEVSDEMRPSRISIEADFLFAHSSRTGFCCWQVPEIGSWYIHALCEELEKNKSTDLLKILTIIHGRANEKIDEEKSSNENKHHCKMPYFKTTLTKELYFNNVKAS